MIDSIAINSKHETIPTSQEEIEYAYASVEVVQDNFNAETKNDVNHMKKSFVGYLEKALNTNKKMIPGISDCFYGIREKIKKWYTFLLFTDMPTDQKKSFFGKTQQIISEEIIPTAYLMNTQILSGEMELITPKSRLNLMKSSNLEAVTSIKLKQACQRKQMNHSMKLN